MADENNVGSIHIDIELETAQMINQAKQANAALNNLGNNASGAGRQLSGFGNSANGASKNVVRAANDASKAARVMEDLGNQIAVLEEREEKGARAAAVLAAQIRAGEGATEQQIREIANLTGRLYDLRNAEDSAAQGQERLNRSSGQLRTGLSAIATAIATSRAAEYTKDFFDIADAMTQLQARINRLSPSVEEGRKTFQSLANIASETGASLKSTTKLWENLTSSLKQTGASNTQVLALTDTLQKIGSFGGSTSQEMANALRQFGQSISSGTVRAQEFNSILEQMPELGRQIAAGLGVSLAELRQLMLAGKLSAEDALNAITKQGQTVNDEFNKVPRTLEQATNALEISFQLIVKQINDATGASSKLVKVIDGIARAFDAVSGKALTFSQRLEDLKGAQDEYDKRSKTYTRLGLDGWAAQAKGVSNLARNVAQFNLDLQAATSLQAQAAGQKITVPKTGTAKQTKEQKQAAAAAKRLAAQQEQVAQKLEDLRQKASLAADSTKELSRQQAILQAQQSLGKAATADQIKQAGEYAAQIYDTAAALKQQQQAQQGQKAANKYIAEGNTRIDPSTGKAADPNAQIDQQEQERIAAIEKYEAIDVQNRQLYEDAKTAIHQKAADARKQIAIKEQQTYERNLSQLLGAASDSLGTLAGAVGDAAGKSSVAYQALFAVSKGFAMAQAALNLQTAISNAMALPWPANIPAIAQAVAAGGQIVSTISGIAFGGGRKNGGPVSGSSLYQVGEGGKPEIFQANNGSQYMIPGDNGSVLSNRQLGTSTGSGGYQQTVNFTINTTNGIDDATQSRIVSTIKEVTLSMMREQSQRSGGMLEPRRQR